MAALSRTGLTPRKTRVVLSLTPLIDVVFILLVFFMLVSQFASWRHIDLTPQVSASSGSAGPSDLMVVDLAADGSIQVDGAPYETLAAALRVMAATTATRGPVEVRSEADVPIQAVVDSVEALAAAGYGDVRVQAERP